MVWRQNEVGSHYSGTHPKKNHISFRKLSSALFIGINSSICLRHVASVNSSLSSPHSKRYWSFFRGLGIWRRNPNEYLIPPFPVNLPYHLLSSLVYRSRLYRTPPPVNLPTNRYKTYPQVLRTISSILKNWRSGRMKGVWCPVTVTGV